MKKLLAITSAVLLAATMGRAASINWVTAGQQIFGPEGTLAPAGWAVALVYAGVDAIPDALGVADIGGPGVSGNDALAAIKHIGEGISKAALQPGSFQGVAYQYTYGVTQLGGQTVDQGDVFYIRVFNSADIASATMYLDITSPGYVIAATDNTGSDSFYITTPAGPGGWQPIPEPASLALAGLGAMAVALRRRFGRKA